MLFGAPRKHGWRAKQQCTFRLVFAIRLGNFTRLAVRCGFFTGHGTQKYRSAQVTLERSPTGERSWRWISCPRVICLLLTRRGKGGGGAQLADF